MAKIEKARKNSHEAGLLAAAMRDFHPDLEAHGVTVALEFASISEEAKAKGESAVKLHGYPCIAKVKIMPLTARRYGSPDAVITFDHDDWKNMTDRECVAILDHKLKHLEVATDKDGSPRIDDVLRPRLKIRPHDVQVGWFRDVADRHGRHSNEVKQAESILREPANVQAFFRFLQPGGELETDGTVGEYEPELSEAVA